MTPHVIRLRGFWATAEVEPGRFRHSRPFGRPTFPPGETVWLVGTAAAVWLNDELLGEADGRFAFDVTAALLPRNELQVETATPDPPTDVAVEVRPG